MGTITLEIEQREELIEALTEELNGLQNDYAIIAINHGTNESAVHLMIYIMRKIHAVQNLLHFYKNNTIK